MGRRGGRYAGLIIEDCPRVGFLKIRIKIGLIRKGDLIHYEGIDGHSIGFVIESCRVQLSLTGHFLFMVAPGHRHRIQL